jgi:hypothetical protein
MSTSFVSRLFGFAFRLVFGLLAVLIGISIIAWVCYNEFIARQSEYPGTSWWQPFGIAPLMIGIGVYWLRGLRRKRFSGYDA